MTIAKRPYKLDVVKNTLTITKEFEDLIADGDAEAMDVMDRFKKMFPQLIIKRATRKTPKNYKNSAKGLTYEKMESYILMCQDAERLLLNFAYIKNYARTLGFSYGIVYEWFMEQFPNYGDRAIPTFNADGKIVAKVIPIENYLEEKKKENEAERIGA